MTSQRLTGFEPLIDRYSGFLLDQWGVLHNGARVYPGVPEVLHRLRQLDKPVVLLSNSGKRAADNRCVLARLGIDASLYRAVITSGEVAWRGLQRRERPFFAALGRRCWLVSRDGDRNAVAGLGLELCEGPADADFVLLAGTDSSAETARKVAAALRIARDRGLPMICSNPDFSSVEPGSDAGVTPGTLARDYERAGGEVYWVGKPWPAVYHAALAELALPAAELLMVGDSLHHDILGAHRLGIDGALLAHGIHSQALLGRVEPLTALAALCRDEALPAPRWLLDRLSL